MCSIHKHIQLTISQFCLQESPERYPLSRWNLDMSSSTSPWPTGPRTPSEQEMSDTSLICFQWTPAAIQLSVLLFLGCMHCLLTSMYYSCAGFFGAPHRTRTYVVCRIQVLSLLKMRTFAHPNLWISRICYGLWKINNSYGASWDPALPLAVLGLGSTGRASRVSSNPVTGIFAPTLGSSSNSVGLFFPFQTEDHSWKREEQQEFGILSYSL